MCSIYKEGKPGKVYFSMEETSIPILEISYPPNLISCHGGVAADRQDAARGCEKMRCFFLSIMRIDASGRLFATETLSPLPASQRGLQKRE